MKSQLTSSTRLLKKSIPVMYLIIGLLIIAALAGWRFVDLNAKYKYLSSETTETHSEEITMNQLRTKDFPLVGTIRLVDLPIEDEELKPLKNDISLLLDSKKKVGQIQSASVYLRRLNDGGWTGINCTEGFQPGSLLKVPVLITYLKQAEKIPGLLNKELHYERNGVAIPMQTFSSSKLVSGKNYKIKDLIYLMIAKSDNYATHLLNENMDISQFEKLFTDIGISKPNVKDKNYSITISDYARFMRVLYNSTYLTENDSEYALDMLAQCEFKEGMTKNIPQNIVIAHKFGEQSHGEIKELHESGIFYIGQKTYLLVVMTKGQDVKQLPNILSEVSDLVFSKMNN